MGKLKNSKKNIAKKFKENRPKVVNFPKMAVNKTKPVKKDHVNLSKVAITETVNKMLTSGFTDAFNELNPNCKICGESFKNVERVESTKIAERELFNLEGYVDFMSGIKVESDKRLESESYHLLCKECNRQVTLDSLESLREIPENALKVIALSNYLHDYEVRQKEYLFHTTSHEKITFKGTKSEIKDYTELYYLLRSNADGAVIRNTVHDYIKAKDNLTIGLTLPTYSVLYHEVIPYKVPLACQSINVPDCNNADCKESILHLMIYPLETESIITYFKLETCDKGYEEWFKGLTSEEQLNEINKQILSGSESFYIDELTYNNNLDLNTKSLFNNKYLGLQESELIYTCNLLDEQHSISKC